MLDVFETGDRMIVPHLLHMQFDSNILLWIDINCSVVRKVLFMICDYCFVDLFIYLFIFCK